MPKSISGTTNKELCAYIQYVCIYICMCESQYKCLGQHTASRDAQLLEEFVFWGASKTRLAWYSMPESAHEVLGVYTYH
jgi:hypothetical protein